MKYRVIREMPFIDAGTTVDYSSSENWEVEILSGVRVIRTNKEALSQLISEGWLEKIGKEEMIDINGKKWSLSTIKEALRKHAK